MSRVMMDKRFMVDAKPIKGALKSLTKAEAVEFKTMDSVQAGRSYGVTGQSIRTDFPFAVEVDGMGNHYVKSEQLVPILLAAIQELSAKVTKLEKAAKASE